MVPWFTKRCPSNFLAEGFCITETWWCWKGAMTQPPEIQVETDWLRVAVWLYRSWICNNMSQRQHYSISKELFLIPAIHQGMQFIWMILEVIILPFNFQLPLTISDHIIETLNHNNTNEKHYYLGCSSKFSRGQWWQWPAFPQVKCFKAWSNNYSDVLELTTSAPWISFGWFSQSPVTQWSQICQFHLLRKYFTDLFREPPPKKCSYCAVFNLEVVAYFTN